MGAQTIQEGVQWQSFRESVFVYWGGVGGRRVDSA